MPKPVILSACAVAAAVCKRSFVGIVATATTIALSASSASSQEPHFSGETIQLLGGFSEGSKGNTIFKEWGRTLERLYPGVRVVVRTNSGGTSALAAALLYEAEPDGRTIGTSDMDSIMARAVGNDIQDISKFAVIGAMSSKQDTLFASAGSGITSIQNLKERTAILPVRSTVSSDYFTGLLLNAYLGTRIKPVTGYSSAEGALAFQSGEGQLAIFNEPDAEKTIEDGTGVPILVLTFEPQDGPLADVPTLAEVAGDKRFAWILGLSKALSHGRILAAPAETPEDRLETLRDAFMNVTQDPEFISVVSPLSTLSPIRGDRLEELIRSIGATTDDFGAKLDAALECGKQRSESGGDCVL